MQHRITFSNQFPLIAFPGWGESFKHAPRKITTLLANLPDYGDVDQVIIEGNHLALITDPETYINDSDVLNTCFNALGALDIDVAEYTVRNYSVKQYGDEPAHNVFILTILTIQP